MNRDLSEMSGGHSAFQAERTAGVEEANWCPAGSRNEERQKVSWDGSGAQAEGFVLDQTFWMNCLYP